MFKITVMSVWRSAIGDTPELGNWPQVVLDYLEGFSWKALTHENAVPDPNIMMVGATVDQATLNLIEADINYEVLSSEEVQNEL